MSRFVFGSEGESSRSSFHSHRRRGEKALKKTREWKKCFWSNKGWNLSWRGVTLIKRVFTGKRGGIPWEKKGRF